MKYLLLCFVVLASIFHVAGAADISNEGLRERCSKKTLVFNGRGEKVGERPDGFCDAYLSATLDVLKNLPGTACKGTNDRAPEYLLSVYETFVRDRKIASTDSASKTLLLSFRRAFDCRSN